MMIAGGGPDDQVWLDRISTAIQAHVQERSKVLEQRLDDMDRATALLSTQTLRVPSEVDRQVGHVREVHAEKFSSIANQFSERDHRSERESRDNKVAVDAAFAAQKEAAAEQNKSNTLAIMKSETATTEAINKLEQLVQAALKGLEGKIGDMTDRINRVDNAIVGLAQQRAGATGNQATIYMVVSAVVGIAAVVISIIVATHK
jgi:cation transport regulator ChaB